MSNNYKIPMERLSAMADHPLTLKNWYMETFPANFTMDYHSHPQIEIMYCQYGGFDFVYRKDKNSTDIKSVFVRSNSLILINTGYYHKLANLLPSTRIANLEFVSSTDKSAEHLSCKPVAQSMLSLNTLAMACPKLKKLLSKDKDFYIFSDNGTVLSTMTEIIQATAMPFSEEKSLLISLLTSKLFIDISRCNSPENHIKTGIVHLDNAMKYINTHFTDKITVDDVALATNVSKVYLQKLFKNQFKKTIHEVIVEKKLNQAKYMLEHSNLSVSEIAQRCGFSSSEHLRSVFHRAIAASPQAYRKNIINKKILYFSHTGEDKIINNK